ncbi:MAG: hypothetical protein Q4D04_09685 [Clostridia bacterium]|nr:hypothetical protein [Clostridia bacterium]
MEMAPTWSKCSIKTIRDGGNWHDECLTLAKKKTPAGKDVSEIILCDAALQLGVG